MFDTRGTAVPMNSIAIIDTTRAVFIDAQCRAVPMVTIPVSPRPPGGGTAGGDTIRIPVPPPPSQNPNVGGVTSGGTASPPIPTPAPKGELSVDEL
jgi:hypothetical protein